MRRKLTWMAAGLAGAGAGALAIGKAWKRQAPDSPFLKRERVLAMAHRGGEGLWPPNTLLAFEKAAALGVDVLETDLHSTADSALVLMHDPTVDSNTNGSGPIHSFTLAELKKLDAGYRWTADDGHTYPYRGQGIQVPTLEEVIQAFPGMRINIDIKQAEPSIVEPFSELLYRYDMVERVMVGSFHDRELARFRLLCPEAATAAGVRETRLFYTMLRTGLAGFYPPRAQAFQVPEFAGQRRLVSPAFVRAAHAHNIQVHIWTVNEVEDMQRLIEWGVDGLMSDFPDRLMAVIESQAAPHLSPAAASL